MNWPDSFDEAAPTGRQIGVVDEFLSRLVGHPVKIGSSVNHTSWLIKNLKAATEKGDGQQCLPKPK